MESIQACSQAAQDHGVPIIVQCYHMHLPFSGVDYIAALARTAASHVDEGLCIGLDHGQSFEQAVECIDHGFTGVMIDLSSDNIERNIRETQRVVEYAHARNVSVEAELGTILSGSASPEEIATGYTDPEAAKYFVEHTHVDCLAVSIGTAHGPYAHTPRINFPLLEELIKTVPCPIVVHGGSGTPDEDVARMVRLGIAKFNVGTDFFAAYNRAMEQYYDGDGVKDIFTAEERARKAVYDVASHKLDVLTCCRV
jgi:ketose-bisphosphate aldolase